MKKFAILTIFFTLLLTFATKISVASKESFVGRMDAIIEASEKGNEQIGIRVVSLNKGDSLYSHKENILLNPASCTKLITTAAALKLLGPDFKFHTKFYTDRRPTEGVVSKMWVKGSGDPSIVLERLWKTARDIANTGLKRIDGDIVIDDHYFDGYTYPGYKAETGNAYTSLTGAASLNFNTITVIVSPSSRYGTPPHVSLDTAGPYFRVINTATTGTKDSKDALTVTRTEKEGEDIITVSGSIPVDSEPQYVYRNITNPPIYFGLALKTFLAQNGVTVGGKVVSEIMPGGGYLLLDSVSKTLSLIVLDMNKFSNNFIAEQLVKTLAAQIGGEPGSTARGITVINNFLTHLGVPESSYRLVNGSGFTPENRVSASAIVTVLANLYSDYHISPEAMASLGVIGVDGTVKDRKIPDTLKGLVRAKSGSLSAVSALVGTVPSSSGEMLGYAILMNGNTLGWLEGNKYQEEMLNAMAAFAR